MNLNKPLFTAALAATFFTFLLLQPVQAQYTNPYTGTTWNNPMSSYLDTVIMGNNRMTDLIIQNSIDRRRLKRSLARRRASKGKSSKTSRVQRSVKRPSKVVKSKMASAKSARVRVTKTPVAPIAAPADSFASAARATSFKFKASSVVSQKMAQLLIPDAKDRPKAAQLFGWCLKSAREDFRKNTGANLPTDNVARALAYFLMSSRGLALTRNGEKIGQNISNPTDAQADALRQQVAFALSGDAAFRAKTDRQKQEMYEMMLILAAYSETVYGVGLQKDNVEAQELARGLARDSLKKLLNLQPEKMRFTDAGLQVS